jgi:hypothetical protein
LGEKGQSQTLSFHQCSSWLPKGKHQEQGISWERLPQSFGLVLITGVSTLGTCLCLLHLGVCENLEYLWGWGVVQWYSTCLACMRLRLHPQQPLPPVKSFCLPFLFSPFPRTSAPQTLDCGHSFLLAIHFLKRLTHTHTHTHTRHQVH